MRALHQLAEIFASATPQQTPAITCATPTVTHPTPVASPRVPHSAPAPRLTLRSPVRIPTSPRVQTQSNQSPIPATPPPLRPTVTAMRPPPVASPRVPHSVSAPRLTLRSPARIPASPRVQTRQRQSPITAPPPTLIATVPRTAMPPPRPHRINLPCPKMARTPPHHHEDGNHPNLIEPDVDDPVLHRYPLRSQMQANSIVQSVRDTLQKSDECNSVIDETTGDVHEYRHLMRTPAKKVWETALANDLGRLAQGVGTRMQKGTNTIRFVGRKAVPKDRKVTYARLVASLRPHKKRYIEYA